MDDLRAVAASIEPDDRLAGYLGKVRERAYTIIDADVESLKEAGATEDEIFEQTVAAAISEGLRRLDAAEAAIG